MGFQSIPKSVTFNDLERLQRRYARQTRAVAAVAELSV